MSKLQTTPTPILRRKLASIQADIILADPFGKSRHKTSMSDFSIGLLRDPELAKTVRLGSALSVSWLGRDLLGPVQSVAARTYAREQRIRRLRKERNIILAELDRRYKLQSGG